jgi:hypothetical protein
MPKVPLPANAKLFYALGMLCSSYFLITLRKAKCGVVKKTVLKLLLFFLGWIERLAFIYNSTGTPFDCIMMKFGKYFILPMGELVFIPKKYVVNLVTNIFVYLLVFDKANKSGSLLCVNTPG